MKITFTTSLVMCLTMSSSAALAETLTFRGTAAPTCALNTPIDGTIVLQGNLRAWATATPATIVAVNTTPATLTVTKPSDWASAPSGTPSTTFSVAASTTGANVGTLTGTGNASSGPLTALGSSILAVSLSAQATSPYRAGLHTAEVTVTCTVP